MMTSSVPISNKIVMNKYLWMSRQLRNFNDVGSIINWANAMLLVKGLLLDPLPASPVFANEQPSSQPSLPQRTIPHQFTTNNLQRIYPERSITPPTTICFEPSKKKALTKSTSRCSNYVPTKPAPLTIYTIHQPTISPTNDLSPCPKRRKIAIQPAVDYHASTSNLANSKSSSQPATTITTTCTPTQITTITQNPSPRNAWLFCYDNTTGVSYYWNKISGRTQRKKPAGFDGNPGRSGPERFLPLTKKYPL